MACETWCSKTGGIPTKEDPESRLDDWKVNVSDFSNNLTSEILKHFFSGGAQTAAQPTEYWIACHSTACTDSTPGTELSGDNYTRSQATFEELSDRVWKSASEVNGSIASAQWAPILAISLYTAQVGGTYLGYGNLSAGFTVEANKYFTIAAGNLTLEFIDGSA